VLKQRINVLVLSMETVVHLSHPKYNTSRGQVIKVLALQLADLHLPMLFFFPHLNMSKSKSELFQIQLKKKDVDFKDTSVRQQLQRFALA
jgi:hypothetical protein